MSQTERLYKLKSLLDAGQCLSKARLLKDLGTSPATLKRDLAHLRDRMNAPIVFDRERGGWRLDRAATVVGTPCGQSANCLACGSAPKRFTPCSPCSTCWSTWMPAACWHRTSSR